MRERSKYGVIASQIHALIDQEGIQVGARLPTERELASRFGVSRATIRQAVVHLQALGHVEVKPGSGTYVVDRVADAANALPEMNALELTQARSLLESEGAALAAVHITDEELDRLDECIKVMNESLPGKEQAADDADRDFHLIIARASRNTAILYTVQMFWRMRNEIDAVKRVYEAVCTLDTGPRGKEHSDILRALRRRNPMDARVAMRAHFFRLLESMLDVSTTKAIEEVHQRADEERQRFLMNPAVIASHEQIIRD